MSTIRLSLRATEKSRRGAPGESITQVAPETVDKLAGRQSNETPGLAVCGAKRPRFENVDAQNC